jgi:hypothetical protein
MTINSHRSGSFSLPGGTNPFPTCPPRDWVTDWCHGLRRGPCEHHPHPASAPDLESEIRPHNHDARCAAILDAPTAPKPVAGVSYIVDCCVYDPRASVASAEWAAIGRTSPHLWQHEHVTDWTPTLRCQSEAPRPWFFFFAKGGRCVGDAVAKASAAVARAPDVFRRTSRVLRWRPPWSRVNLALFCVRCYGPALDFSDHASIIHGKIYR